MIKHLQQGISPIVRDGRVVEERQLDEDFESRVSHQDQKDGLSDPHH